MNTSNINLSNIFTTLLMALLGLTAQPSLSFPIRSVNGGGYYSNRVPTHILLSEHSDMLVAVMQNGSVSATGEYFDTNTRWLATAGANEEIRFSSTLYSNQYLILAIHQNKTFLLAHNPSEPLTVGDLPVMEEEVVMEVEGGQVEETSSGDGAPPSLLGMEEEEREALTNSTEEEEGGDDDNRAVLFSVDWILESHPLNQLAVRFRASFPGSEHDSCYLAFDSHGHPERNLCESSVESSVIVFKNSK